MRRIGPLSVVLSLLVGCAAVPSLSGGFAWPAPPVRSFLAQAAAAPQAVEVDFEAVTPQRAEHLRQGGVQLPRASAQLTDPRAHRDFVDGRVTAVGFGLSAGGYLLYCEGLPQPVLVPESYVDLGLTQAEPGSDVLHADRDEALADLESHPSRSGHTTYAYYRGAGGALIVPTLFSPASTPRVARTMLEVRKHLSDTVQRELRVLLVNLTGTRVLQGVFSRVVRMSAEPAPPSRQPLPRPAPSEPESAPTPTPARGALAPSPGLVRALTGNNPTPPVGTGPRLPQDMAVSPEVPALRRIERSIGPSPSQNAQLQADIEYLKDAGAENIRVNQQQIMVLDKQRVGINRPDLQFDYNGRRYHVEYDTPTSSRGLGHQSRIISNDPDAEIILLIVP